MPSQTFVARERELAYLQTFLTRALESQGQVVFIAGEAGSGKTALLREFVRLAQDARADLVVAVGECNAQTGIGDPYLPFREVLGLLSGDVDTKVARGAITQENANRLRALLQTSGQALVEVGPTLVNTLVPGTLVLAMAARFLAKQAGWLKPLEKLNERKSATPSEGGQDQSHIFEQYTNVLKVIAAKQPLILVVDDLQWADAGSISLLFHLSRRISESHILLVGAYRPDEIALGRGGERHPLDKVLAECKRYWGDIVLDLDQGAESENRQFVDAFLDTEPNCFGNEFQEALYHRTGGHALFTVELLRTMQERGDLQRDGQGRWIENRTLDWTTLPARVEGVIEERIGRLEKELREILRTASVEGQDFTAQVIARVQEIRERQLLRDLSEELDKRHRLVREQGETRVGSQVLSRYQFSHALFQRYLYNDLSAGERRLLHGEVAHVLEELHAGSTDAIAVQLARHYSEAGDDAKAFEYRIKAGNVALRSYAWAEARLHYANALESAARLPDNDENRRRRVDTIIRLASTSFAAEATEQKMRLLLEAESLAKQLIESPQASDADRLRLARVYFWIGDIHLFRNELREALDYDEKAANLARVLGNEKLLAILSNAIGRVFSIQGRLGDATQMLAQVVPLFEKAGNWSEWIWAVGFLGSALAAQGRFNAGLAEGQRALARAQQTNHLTGIALSQTTLSLCYLAGGDLPRALETSRSAVSIAEQTGDYQFVCLASGFVSWAETRLGQHDAALNSMARVMKIAQRIGGKVLLADWHTFIQGEIAFNLGRIDEALTLAQRAAEMAQSVDGLFAQGHAHRVWGQALATSASPLWDEVESHMATSFQSFEAGQGHVEAARTQVAWGELCRRRGNLQAARQHFEQAVTILEQTDLTAELEKTRGLLVGV